MSAENVISVSYEELEQRRRRASAARKASRAQPPPPPQTDSEAMAVINEIFNPTLKLPVSTGPYRLPDEVSADDVAALKDLDISKVAELKEVFVLFDADNDGLISKDDLRFTYTALGADVSEELIEEMLKEAKDPLDYEAFVELMSHRTIELDPEDVLLEAWSKWDDYGIGKIEEKRMYEELTNYGDALSTSEADEAFKHAPLAKPKTLEEPPMIDYPAFCRILCGMRKRKPPKDENYCLDYIEIFPYLREAVIENSTNPDYVLCNRTAAKALPMALTLTPATTQRSTTAMATATLTPASAANATAATAANVANAGAAVDLNGDAFIYSAGKVFGIRVRFQKPKPLPAPNASGDWFLNINGEYRFLKKDNFKNDGRLIPGSYCDYYFFADANANPTTLEIWQYFHSPRFPAKYPAHIKCAYKFIGRPESRVEIVFEELQIPKQGDSCNMDKLTIFDSESANMNAVIDVVCDALPTRRIISSGPDLLIEFNASSNVTAKGFRGKFKFLHNEIEQKRYSTLAVSAITETAIAMEKVAAKKQQAAAATISVSEWGKFFKNNENCKQTFDSRVNKSGKFDTAQLFPAAPNVNVIPVLSPSRVQCRFEFYGEADERIQIKFLDFYIPAEHKNSSECKPSDSLQLLTQVRGKYEAAELFCGAFLPKPIMSKGPKMLLQFLGRYPPTGSKINYYGFKAEYRFVKNFGILTGHQLENNCTFLYNSTDRKSGWFGSPNFPGFYPQNMVCHYLFHGESEEKVIIRFTFFDVEGIGTCEYLTASDYVEFSNFMSTDRKYGKYCGKRDKFEVRSDGRFFRVSFYSNDRFDKTGFRALYDFESKHTRVENTSMQSYVSAGRHAAVLPCLIVHQFITVFICQLYFIRWAFRKLL